MTETPGAALRTYLFEGSEGEDVEAISRSLHELGPKRAAVYGVRRLGTEALEVLDNEVARVTEKLLAYDPGDLLVEGWKKYSTLREAAERTVANPEQEEVVSLAAHTITWDFRPKVDVLVNGVRVNTLEFVLTVAFEISGLVAVVRKGWLVSVRSGDCVLSTSLSLEGATIVPKRESMIDDLASVLPLRKPIRLVRSAGPPNAG